MLQHFNGHQKLGEEEGKLFLGFHILEDFCCSFVVQGIHKKNRKVVFCVFPCLEKIWRCFSGQLPNAMLGEWIAKNHEKTDSYTLFLFQILCRFPSDPCMVDLPLQSYTCTKKIKQMWVTIYTIQCDFCAPPNLLRNNICQNFWSDRRCGVGKTCWEVLTWTP